MGIGPLSALEYPLFIRQLGYSLCPGPTAPGTHNVIAMLVPANPPDNALSQEGWDHPSFKVDHLGLRQVAVTSGSRTLVNNHWEVGQSSYLSHVSQVKGRSQRSGAGSGSIISAATLG